MKLTLLYPVKLVMSKPLIMVDVNASVEEARNVMIEKNIGAVVVSRDGAPIGILTERDVLRISISGKSCDTLKVRNFMSQPLITIDHETSISEAVRTMIMNNIRRLLVKENGKIIAIITEGDLLKGTRESFLTMDMALASF